MRLPTHLSRSLFSVGLIALTLGACALEEEPGDDTNGDDVVGDDATGDDGDDAPPSPCTESALFAGNPLYDGDAAPSPAGTALLADPPLAWRDTVIDGDIVYTHVGQELWGGDRSTIRRIVGASQDGLADFRAGACAQARLAYTDGIAVLPDGSLIVADFNANALVKVTDPMGASCQVSYYAGTGTAIDGVSPASPPNIGDADGIGAAARFGLPLKPVADAAGTVYVLDEGGQTIRKVVPSGAVGAVSTLAFAFTEDDVEWTDLALAGGSLIVVGNGFGNQAYVVEVDPSSGAHRILASGDGAAFAPLEPGASPTLASVVEVGGRLYVSGQGRIWEITDAGEVIHAAGGYSTSELANFPFDDYDPSAPHDPRDLALKSIGDAQSSQFMTADGDDLYFAARATGTGAYVVRLGCPR